MFGINKTPLTLEEAKKFYLSCKFDRRTMLESELYKRYSNTPGVSYEQEQLWKCDYIDEAIANWDSYSEDKKSMLHYEFHIIMNSPKYFAKYVPFVIGILDEILDMSEESRYKFISRYTYAANWAAGYSQMCIYGDYADLIYGKIVKVLSLQPDSERKNKFVVANEAAYNYVKSEKYFLDCIKYNSPRVYKGQKTVSK